jgi:tetratricopeptide (TPR) repeat protein
MSGVGGNPYPGSRAFRAEDHDRFHGRAADASAIIDLWTANRLTIVVGPPGCGKTSLLSAGVYPSMPGKRAATFPLGSLSHGMWHPVAALPEHNPFTLALLRSWSPGDVPTRLAGLTVSDFVRRRTQESEEVTFAAIDQLDDLMSDPSLGSHGRWARRFLGELVQAGEDHPRLHLLLVARSEALSLLTASVGGGARYELAALTVRGAVEAVTRPALAAGRLFSGEVASEIIDNLRTGGVIGAQAERRAADALVEPSLLQAVCQPLWDELPAGISGISQWEIGDFSDDALAAYCARVISQVAAEHAMPPRMLRSWLVDTFVTDQGSRGRAYEGAISTAALPNAVPRSLVDRHLLTSEMDEAVRRYRLLSSRLIEPLLIADVDHSAVPTAADCLRSAERAMVRGELDLAGQHGTCALRSVPSLRERAQATSLLGNVAYRQGEPADALACYREAASLLQAAGDTAAAAYQQGAVGQALLAEGRLSEALPELRAAVERAPKDLMLQTQLALALWHVGEGRAAVAILNAVLAIDGANLEALRSRGEILADLGDASAAILDLDRPSVADRPSTRAARGLALAGLGDHYAATREVGDAVAAAQRSGPVLLFAARACELTGDKASCREWVRLAIDATDPPLSPSHQAVARKLARRLAERG